MLLYWTLFNIDFLQILQNSTRKVICWKLINSYKLKGMTTFMLLVIASILRNTKWQLMQVLMPIVLQVISSKNSRDKKNHLINKVRFHLLLSDSLPYYFWCLRIQWNGCTRRSLWWCWMDQWLDCTSYFCLLVERKIIDVFPVLEYDGPTDAFINHEIISIFVIFSHLQFFRAFLPNFMYTLAFAQCFKKY